MARVRSQSECLSHLICRYRGCATGDEVCYPLLSDPTIFEVDHCLVLLDKLCWHDGSGSLLIAATGDVGDLTAEGSPVDGVGKVIPCLADGKFRYFCAHV